MRGRRLTYSEAELAFVWARRDMLRGELHAAFVVAFGRVDVSVDNLKSLCTRNGWTTREHWTPAEDAQLTACFSTMPTARAAAIFGRSVYSTNNRAYTLGLRKSGAYLASPEAGRLRRGDGRGGATRFKPGQTPLNKGKKHPKGWAPGRMRDSQFTKGQAGWNWQPIGSERLIGGYLYTKSSDFRLVPYTVNWRPTHVLNWEAAYGPLPDGHCLKSVDGDRLNTDPTNWQSVPRAILPRLNGGRGGRLGYDQAPTELKPTIMAVAKLSHAAKTRGRAKADV